MTNINKNYKAELLPLFICYANNIYFKLLLPYLLYIAAILLPLYSFKDVILAESELIQQISSLYNGLIFVYLFFLVFFVFFSPFICLFLSYSNLPLTKQLSRIKSIFTDKFYYLKVFFIILIGLFYLLLLLSLTVINRLELLPSHFHFILMAILFCLLSLKSYFLAFLINFHWNFACLRKSFKASYRQSISVIRHSWLYLLILPHICLVIFGKSVNLFLYNYLDWLLHLVSDNTGQVSHLSFILISIALFLLFLICVLCAITHVARQSSKQKLMNKLEKPKIVPRMNRTTYGNNI